MARKKKVKEKSAGFVTFINDGGVMKVLLLDHGTHISHPKGHIEGSETKKETAIRELMEETGLSPTDMSDTVLSTIKYTIEKRSKIIDKTVYFYACTASGEISLSDEHKRYIMTIPKQARDTLTYETDREALQAALEWFDSLS